MWGDRGLVRCPQFFAKDAMSGPVGGQLPAQSFLGSQVDRRDEVASALALHVLAA